MSLNKVSPMIGVFAALTAFAIDQITKAIVVANAASLSAGISMFGGFNLVFYRNDGVTFPPFSLLLLVPVAYSALFIGLRDLSFGRAFPVGWAFGLGQFGFGISWIAESFFVEAERFGAMAIPAVAGLSAGLAIFPAIAAMLFAEIARRGALGSLLACLLFGTSWTAAEWLRGHVLTGFRWNLAGYALADYAAFRPPAAWVGG